MRRAAFLVASAALTAICSPSASASADKRSQPETPAAGTAPEPPSFEDFVQQFKRNYHPDSAEYLERRSLFQQSLAEVQAVNTNPTRLWTASINNFADFSRKERLALCGLKHRARRRHDASGGSLLDVRAERVRRRRGRSPLPQQLTWMNLTCSKKIPQQGTCGSCWAVTTVSVLQAHHEIYRGKARSFSAQELVSCVPNPKQCGGNGGCSGATVELGMTYTMRRGLSTESKTPYAGIDQPCDKRLLSLINGEDPDRPAGGVTFGMTGWHRLPRNKEEPLARAVVDRGPVAVSVSADGWFSYSEGIFDSCPRNCVVNHAVTLFGFSHGRGSFGSKVHNYWLIRNSWGEDWGEQGFIRLLRRKDEEKHCGIDSEPEKGVGCKGGPAKVTVCGTCGVLYDSVVPHFARSATAHGRKANGFLAAKPGNASLQGAASSEPTAMALAIIGADAVPRLVRRERSKG